MTRPLKYRLITILSVLLNTACLGQFNDSLVSKKEISFFSHQLDSLPIRMRPGNAMENRRACGLPGHVQYSWTSEGIGVTMALEALSFTGKLKQDYINVLALKYRAYNYYDQKNYPTCLYYYQVALAISVADNFSFEELHGLRPAINNSCFLAGDYELAMKTSTEGLARAEKFNDQKQVGHFNNVLGYIHMKQGNFEEASRYYVQYLDFASRVQDTLLHAHALLNIADLQTAQKKYDSALHYLQLALADYRSIESKGLFNLEDRLGYVDNKMGEVYKLKTDNRAALPYALAAVSILQYDSAFVNDYDEASYYINTGDIYNRLNQPDSAIYYLQKGLNVACRIIHREYMKEAYEQLAIAYAQKSDFQKAYSFQNLFSLLRDSIANESNQREIYRKEAALQLERQHQVQMIALQKQRTLRNISLGIAAFVLLTVVFLYNRYRLKQKNRYQKELNRQQVELFNAIAATQEQERKRIAQDIHDSLGSVLSAAKLKLAEAKELRPELSQDEKFITGINLLDEASAELRSISHNIMPATLSKLGLVPALKNLSEKISTRNGLQVDFQAHDLESRMEEQMEISIYRIILELINNIVKHASASIATVQLLKYPDSINITVEDNGKGFDPAKIAQEKKGIGLGNVVSRVDYMKGAINIDAAEGRGTSVIIDIPL